MNYSIFRQSRVSISPADQSPVVLHSGPVCSTGAETLQSPISQRPKLSIEVVALFVHQLAQSVARFIEVTESHTVLVRAQVFQRGTWAVGQDIDNPFDGIGTVVCVKAVRNRLNVEVLGVLTLLLDQNPENFNLHRSRNFTTVASAHMSRPKERYINTSHGKIYGQKVYSTEERENLVCQRVTSIDVPLIGSVRRGTHD